MQRDADDPILIEALEWLVRLRDQRATDADRQAFRRWHDRDAGHAAAWVEAEALWQRFDVAQPAFDDRRAARRRLRRRQAMLGGAAAALGAGGLWLLKRPDLLAEHRTGIGERRGFTLPDGSRVELGSLSALSVQFAGDARRLRLHRGEAFFDVAPDAARPFIVAAAKGVTRALGTRFDIKSDLDAVTVSVSQHAVLVESEGHAGVEVGEGYQLTYDAAGPGRVTPVDPDAVAAWRRGRILFQDVPLRRVLAELERYRRDRILLLDRELGDIAVTAIFNADQAEDALRIIARALPIETTRMTPFLTFVSRRR